jgi:Tfp pilus assembly protein PilN
MIRINLLGKRKVAPAPFGLDEQLGKLGIRPEDLDELKPGIIRVAVIVSSLYMLNFGLTYYHDQRGRTLDAELEKKTAESKGLSEKLAAKKNIRQQMEQLNKEEAELQRQLNAVSALSRDKSLAFQLMNNTVLTLPPKVWIDSIKMDKFKVSILGKSWEYFPINDFVKTITESTNYTGVNFKEIKAEDAQRIVPGVPIASQRIKTFGVDFTLKTSGE